MRYYTTPHNNILHHTIIYYTTPHNNILYYTTQCTPPPPLAHIPNYTRTTRIHHTHTTQHSMYILARYTYHIHTPLQHTHTYEHDTTQLCSHNHTAQTYRQEHRDIIHTRTYITHKCTHAHISRKERAITTSSFTVARVWDNRDAAPGR